MSAAAPSLVAEDAPTVRYREEPLIADLLEDVRRFDTEAAEATGEDWRELAKHLRSYATRIERHGNRLLEAQS